MVTTPHEQRQPPGQQGCLARRSTVQVPRVWFAVGEVPRQGQTWSSPLASELFSGPDTCEWEHPHQSPN